MAKSARTSTFPPPQSLDELYDSMTESDESGEHDLPDNDASFYEAGAQIQKRPEPGHDDPEEVATMAHLGPHFWPDPFSLHAPAAKSKAARSLRAQAMYNRYSMIHICHLLGIPGPSSGQKCNHQLVMQAIVALKARADVIVPGRGRINVVENLPLQYREIVQESGESPSNALLLNLIASVRKEFTEARKLPNVTGKMTLFASELEVLTKDVAELQGKVPELRSMIRTHDGTIDTATEHITSALQTISQLENRIVHLEKRADAAPDMAELGAITNEITRLKRIIVQDREALGRQTARIDHMTPIVEDIANGLRTVAGGLNQYAEPLKDTEHAEPAPEQPEPECDPRAPGSDDFSWLDRI